MGYFSETGRCTQTEGGNELLGQVPKRVVDAWIREVKRRFRNKSIICLLHKRELRRYGNLPGGLLSYYQAQGFRVKHISAKNYQKPSLSKRKLKKVWKAYKITQASADPLQRWDQPNRRSCALHQAARERLSPQENSPMTARSGRSCPIPASKMRPVSVGLCISYGYTEIRISCDLAGV